MFRRPWLVAILVTTAGCGGSTTTPSTPPAGALHREVSDATGDALPDPSVRVSPDLVHGTIDESAGNITLNVQFASGTFDQSTSRLTVQLDTDQNPLTGIRMPDGLGVEYVVDMWASASQATIFKAVPDSCAARDTCYVQTGTAPRTVLADGMAVTIPLSLFGSADGRMNFRIVAYASIPGAATQTIMADVMPDVTLAVGRVP